MPKRKPQIEMSPSKKVCTELTGDISGLLGYSSFEEDGHAVKDAQLAMKIFKKYITHSCDKQAQLFLTGDGTKENTGNLKTITEQFRRYGIAIKLTPFDRQKCKSALAKWSKFNSFSWAIPRQTSILSKLTSFDTQVEVTSEKPAEQGAAATSLAKQ